jgi:hypothetical protein
MEGQWPLVGRAGELRYVQELFSDLWAIKGDTLGGITSPLTFAENQNAPIVTCWYNLTIKQGGWASADGAQQHCQNGIDRNGRQ